MKIAICDDEKECRDSIIQFIKTHNSNHIFTEFDSAEPLLESINSGENFDVLFLDIQMPNSSGWEAAQYLKKEKLNIYIAMVTVNENYVYDCFDRVDWFAPKPITEERVHKILNKAHDGLFPPIFEFTINRMPMTLRTPEIVYFEAARNYISIHTIDSTYKIRESLSNIVKQFNTHGFAATHKSFFINLEHFKTIDKDMILMKNGDKIPLSRSKREVFFSQLRKHIIRRKSNE